MANKMTPAERAKRVLDDLKNKEAAVFEKLSKKKAVAAKRLSALQLKEDEREMTLIGKHLLADAIARPAIEASLKRASVNGNDLAFLKSRGWAA